MTTALSTNIREANAETIAAAAARLRAGALVAFPTETVYGLGADATQDRAVAAIYEAKGRPRFNPLIVHLAAAEDAARHTVFDSRTRSLAEQFWPGALSLVLPRKADTPISLLCSAGLDSLAVRVPAHPVAQALLSVLGRPVAAPSANTSGGVSPTTAEHVTQSLGERVPMILDGGACFLGLESTVLDLSGSNPRLLRPGAVTREALEAAIGPIESAEGAPNSAVKSPGQLPSHYAPGLPLRLEATEVAADEALLAFGPNPPRGAAVTLNLSETGELREAAAKFFAQLRALDRPGLRAIAVMAIPERGLGRAINDRLRRAAAPREAISPDPDLL